MAAMCDNRPKMEADSLRLDLLEMLAEGKIMVINDSRTEYTPYEASIKDIRVLGQVIWFARQLVRVE